MKDKKIIKIAAGLCFVISGALFVLAGSGQEKSEELIISTSADDTNVPAEAGQPSSAGIGDIFVHVCGAVKNPGIYRLPAGSRTGDAIEAAGGFTEDADTDSLNLAELLSDSQQIRAPTKGEAAEQADGKININTATDQQLTALPGIGEAKARAITDYRVQNGRFKKPEDIKKVPGIGDALFERIRDKIKVDG